MVVLYLRHIHIYTYTYFVTIILVYLRVLRSFHLDAGFLLSLCWSSG